MSLMSAFGRQAFIRGCDSGVTLVLVSSDQMHDHNTHHGADGVVHAVVGDVHAHKHEDGGIVAHDDLDVGHIHGILHSAHQTKHVTMLAAEWHQDSSVQGRNHLCIPAE